MNRTDPFPTWVADAVFYQIFPDRFYNGDPGNDPPGVRPWSEQPSRENFFGGDLKGIFQKLDYLQGLGVNALYLNPIFRAGTNHKYDTYDYYQVDPSFGTNALLKELVVECHSRRMRVILDGVFNHSGPGFFAFRDLMEKGEASEYRDWFTVLSYPLTEEPLSYRVCGDAVYLPKLNTGNRAVQEFILDVARFWMEVTGIDGWRLDVPFKIPFEFWREFRRAVKSINPEAYLVGEVWREAGPWVQGDVFDGVTNYRLRELILDYCGRQILDAEDFAFETRMLRQAHGQARFAMLNVLGSHDTARIVTELKEDLDLLRIAMICQFTAPGAPMIYYGDEVGLAGGNDPDCRKSIPWGEEGRNAAIESLVRKLIELRKAHTALRYGEAEALFAFNGVYVYRLSHEGDEAIIVLNPRGEAHHVTVPVKSVCRKWKDVFTGTCWNKDGDRIEFGIIPRKTGWLLLGS